MRINHVALYVTDLEAEKAFFEHYFGGKAGERYINPHTLFSSYMVRFDGDTTLEIMTRPETVREYGYAFPTGYVHIAFSLGSREAVDALTERIQNDGYIVADGPRMTGDGFYESAVLDPEGNRIEITI